jgi:uncharacterized protein DUF3455
MRNRIAVLAAATLSLALPAAAAIPEPGGLTPRLRASAAEEPAFILSGNGVYIYQCRAGAFDPDAYGWYFVAPDATLYDGSHEVARHATVGLFESLSDRTSVSGIVRATQPAGSGNLPWATIRARPIAESGGLFQDVTTIQRVNTAGGAPPRGSCGADNVGEEARVAFNADYYFYKRRGAS